MRFLEYVSQGPEGGYVCHMSEIDVDNVPADAEIYSLYLFDHAGKTHLVGHSKESHGYAVTNDGAIYQEQIAIQVYNSFVPRSGITTPQYLGTSSHGWTSWTSHYTQPAARQALIDLEKEEFGIFAAPDSAFFVDLAESEFMDQGRCTWIKDTPEFHVGSPDHYLVPFVDIIFGLNPHEPGPFTLKLHNTTQSLVQEYTLQAPDMVDGFYDANVPGAWSSGDVIEITMTHIDTPSTSTFYRSGLYYHTLP